MKHKHKICLLSLVLLLIRCDRGHDITLPGVTLSPGSEREIAYTDKGDAFWVTSAGSYQNAPWQGLTASKRAYFKDLFIYADGKLLPRQEARVKLDPVKLEREYPKSGIRETWTLLDDQRTLVVQLEADKATHWRVQPAILGGSQPDDFEISNSNHELNIHYKRLKDIPSSHPWLKIRFSQAMQWSSPAAPDKPLFSTFLTAQAECENVHELLITISLHDELEKFPLDPAGIAHAQSERKQRITARLAQTTVTSSSKTLDQAIAWAHASLDALIMDQTGKGIYAGLPWFDDYWGRDVFISFAGAVLVSGQFAEARQILLSFADLQNKDPADRYYGRVPNRAQPNDIIYNTTDGTPWFVRSVWDYFRYSGDEQFLERIWPAVRHATLGALRNWTDSSGLLRHGDAETWMDARGPDGAWSPRGDRAIEIQFIWRDQLEITRRMAEMFGDAELENRATQTLTKLENGLKRFRSGDPGYFVDHLNPDDTRDPQVRPNVFLVPQLFAETCDWSSFKTLAPQLITRDGVLSLSQQDPDFHPYHHIAGLYVQDAAYHNGIIWTWNSAATITQAIRFHQYHYAQALFNGLTDQVLHRGAVGTIAELTDAWPHQGQLRLSGTFSQAWSLAEYLRVFYQDILGVQPDLGKARVKISPRLLEGLEAIAFDLPIGGDAWEISYVETGSSFDIHLQRGLDMELTLDLDILHETRLGQLTLTWKTRDLHLRYEKQMGQWTVPAAYTDYTTSSALIDIPMNSLNFCRVDTSIQVPALRGPQHRLLKEKEVIFQGGTYQTFLEVTDPVGDDRGDNSQYLYPLNPQFKKGVADITALQIGQNESAYLFTLEFADLVDPGWHPEYGYQLTYVALGLSYKPDTGTRVPGKNSGTSFRSGFRADEIIYISGGILIVDDDHAPIAEYMPSRTTGAIGNARTDLIQFRIPRELFQGELETAQFQIAVGCQDDHGGAGMGDFREVKPVAGEWTGGGKTASLTSNIYDWLIPENK